jgi:signal transduction histidine kinase
VVDTRQALRREGDVREKLLGIVSHDLRNPLQAVSTASHLLLSSSDALSIVHEIVAAHGGHIDVRSSAGTGTVFRVGLPRALTA